MIRPPYLKSGDHVAIVATARFVDSSEIAPTVQLLHEWGLVVDYLDGLYERHDQFAGTDKHRASMLQRAVNDPSICAVFCARGGYGTVRIIDQVDFSPLRQHPKWIVGYSDVTVLHSHLHNNLQLCTLHATMPVNITQQTLQMPTPAIQTLHDALFGSQKLSYNFEPSNCDVANRMGSVTAPIVGGNLSILYSLLASESDIDTSGKILFIEDLDEYLYHIDRMMQALRRSGKLRNLAGMVVGALSDMHDNSIPFGRNAYQIVSDVLAPFSFPVAFGLPAGHIGLDNRALVVGATASLRVSELEATLSFNL